MQDITPYSWRVQNAIAQQKDIGWKFCCTPNSTTTTKARQG
jgi:hypothetical protein